MRHGRYSIRITRTKLESQVSEIEGLVLFFYEKPKRIILGWIAEDNEVVVTPYSGAGKSVVTLPLIAQL